MSVSSPTPSTAREAQQVAAPQRIVELDAIRGIAILLVLIFHFIVGHVDPEPGTVWRGLRNLFSLSWAGVDLFFVLSGFLIGGILIKHREAENYFTAFYVRRAARLLPLYLLSLAIYVAIGPLLLSSGTQAGVWLVAGEGQPLPVWSYLLYVQNFLMAQTINWGGHWLAPTWSLAVEEQFYLITPLLLRAVPVSRIPSMLGILIAGGIACRAIMFASSGVFLPGYILLITRWDALFIGILGAYAYNDPKLRAYIEANAHRLPRLLGRLMAGICLMIAVGITQRTMSMAVFGYTYLAITSLVAIAVALFVKNRWTALVFRNAALARLGTISYGVYLLHHPVLGLTCLVMHGGTPQITGIDGILIAGLAAILTIGLAELSWRVFEKPILDLGHRFSYRRRNLASALDGARQPA